MQFIPPDGRKAIGGALKRVWQAFGWLGVQLFHTGIMKIIWQYAFGMPLRRNLDSLYFLFFAIIGIATQIPPSIKNNDDSSGTGKSGVVDVDCM